MTRDTFTALMAYAIDADLVSLSVQEVWESFCTSAEKCKDYYQYAKETPTEIFTDYVLFFAKSLLESGLVDYGIYTEDILNYRRK